MPAVLALPAFWAAVGGTAAAGAAVYSAKTQSNAAKRAGEIQERTTTEAINLERENEARRRQEYDEERARMWNYEDQDRALSLDDRSFNREEYGKRQARLAPYRQFGEQGVVNMASLLRPNPTAPSLRIQPRRPPPMPVPPVQAAAMPSRFAPMNFAELLERQGPRV